MSKTSRKEALKSNPKINRALLHRIYFDLRFKVFIENANDYLLWFLPRIKLIWIILFLEYWNRSTERLLSKIERISRENNHRSLILQLSSIFTTIIRSFDINLFITSLTKFSNLARLCEKSSSKNLLFLLNNKIWYFEAWLSIFATIGYFKFKNKSLRISFNFFKILSILDER